MKKNVGFVFAALTCVSSIQAVPAAADQAAREVPVSTRAAELPVTLTSFGAARLGDKIYVYGGHTGEAHDYSAQEQSDRLLSLDLNQPGDAWQEVSRSTRLQGHALVAYDGKLIRVGGFSAMNAEGQEHDLRSTDEVAAFDVTAKQWTSLPSLPEPRSSHDAIILGSTIYVVGGWQLNGEAAEAKWHETAYKMDLSQTAPQWVALAAPPAKLRAISLAAVGDRLAVVGGMGPGGSITAGTLLYDLTGDTWSEGPALAGEGRMLGFGTAALSLPNRAIVSTIDGSLQQLTIGGDRWEPIGRTADARFFHEILPVDEDHIVIVGGANMESGKFLNVDVVELPE